jgi:hypothetical protein
MLTLTTENGPQCSCKSTHWFYEACAPQTWRAHCVGCGGSVIYFHANRSDAKGVARAHRALDAQY